MLQTILTELKGGDRAKITAALSAGVEKICEGFEKICQTGDEFDEAFKEYEKDESQDESQKVEIDFEKMSDDEIDAEMDRQMAEFDKQAEKLDKAWEHIEKGLNAVSECDSLVYGIVDIVCDKNSNESINTEFSKILKEQASKLSNQKAKTELLDTANKIEAFAKDRAAGASVLFGDALYIFKNDKQTKKIKANFLGLLDEYSFDNAKKRAFEILKEHENELGTELISWAEQKFESAKKGAIEILKMHESELGSKLLLWAELKRANSALKAELPNLTIENLEF